MGGASDGNFTAGMGVPTLDGLGAVGGGAHAVDEHVLVEHIAPRTALVAMLIRDVLSDATAIRDDGVMSADAWVGYEAAAAKAGVEVRTLSGAELDGASQVWRAVWGEPVMERHLLTALAHAGNYVAGAFADGRIVGATAGFLGRRPSGRCTPMSRASSRTLPLREWALR